MANPHDIPVAELPVLCKQCGAPVEPDPELRLACRYCGLQDRLPTEIHERTRELRQRLRTAARSAMQVDGLQQSLAAIFESPGPALRLYAPFMILVLGILIYQGFATSSSLSGLPDSVRRQVAPEILGGSVSGFMMMGTMPLALGVGMVIARAIYRRRVRPLLLGRPPREPGRPSRCRSCGGELRDERGPFVACRYCTTPNLLSKEIRAYNQQLLEVEETGLRAQSRRALGTQSGTSLNLTGSITLYFAGAYVLMLFLASLARKALHALLG